MDIAMQIELSRRNPETGSPVYSKVILSAPSCMLEDAAQKIGVTDNRTPFDITVSYCCIDELTDAAFPHTAMDELNFLAGRLKEMRKDQSLMYKALLHQNLTLPDMKHLINLTYGLDAVPSFACSGDREYGRFCIENDMLEALGSEFENLPETVYQTLDAEQVGRKVREAENGAFAGGQYLDLSQYQYKEVYDGVHLPDGPEKPYVFRLQVSGHPDNRSQTPPENQVWVTLPAKTEALNDTANQLGEKWIQDCRCNRFLSSIPQITDKMFKDMDSLPALNELAEKLSALPRESLAKFKAVLEYEDSDTIESALEIADNLNQYEFHSDVRDAADYGRRYLSGHLAPDFDHSLLPNLDTRHLGNALMTRNGAAVTEYGSVQKVQAPILNDDEKPAEKEDDPSTVADDANEERGMDGFHL